MWVLGGLGVVGLAVGTGFAIAAKDKYDSSIKGCEPGNPNLCYPQGLSERSDARSAGDVATVAFSIGAAAIAGGAVLLLTAPRRASDAAALPTLEVAPMMNGAMLRGSF